MEGNIIPIFPGRFQPFHNGHLWVVKEIIKQHRKAIIGIVNPAPLNCSHPDYESFHSIYNPFTYWERFWQIRAVLKAQNLWDYIEIIPLIHPRYYVSIDTTFLPSKKIWYIPPIDKHEVQKIVDFKRQGEEVIPITVSKTFLNCRSTLIRNCINKDSCCYDCYPKEIFDILWNTHLRFNVKSLYEQYPSKAKELLEMSCNKNKNVIIANQKTENTLVKYNWLKALGEGVAQLAGPLGAPLKLLLCLYEDEKEMEREKHLKEILSSHTPIEKEILGQIFEIREGLEKNREYFLELITTIIKSIKDNQTDITKIDAFKIQIPESLINNIITPKILINELIRLFGDDIQALKVIVRENGFPMEKINWNNSPRVVLSDFIDKCRVLNIEILHDIFEAIINDKYESPILSKFIVLISEAKEFKLIKKII